MTPQDIAYENSPHEFPTVELVRYVADTLRALNRCLPECDAALAAADAWLDGAEDRFRDASAGQFEEIERAKSALIEEADEIIKPMNRLIELKRTTHSLIVNWNDRDADEGTFGATVQAWSDEHAEALVRSDMEGTEPFCSYDGTVVEHSHGAAWKARDMETALSDLLAWREAHALPGDADGCWQRARALMDDIRAGR